MDELQEMSRLGRFIHQNFPEETKRIAQIIGTGTIIDVAIYLLEHLDTELGAASGREEELQQELRRHHADFERWEEMADKGARRMVENQDLHPRLVKLEQEIRVLEHEIVERERIIRGTNVDK